MRRVKKMALIGALAIATIVTGTAVAQAGHIATKSVQGCTADLYNSTTIYHQSYSATWRLDPHAWCSLATYHFYNIGDGYDRTGAVWGSSYVGVYGPSGSSIRYSKHYVDGQVPGSGTWFTLY